MQFELIDDHAGLEGVADEWRELEAGADCHVFQSFDFVCAWFRHVGAAEGASPAIVVGREQGIIRLVLPACIIRRGALRFLTWMGGFLIVDYGDVICSRDVRSRLPSLFDEVFGLLRQRTRYHLTYLHNVRVDAAIHGYLSERCAIFRSEVAPYVALEGDFEAFLQGLKKFRKKQKSDTLRQIRRLNEHAPLSFRILQHDDPDLADVVSTFIAQKRRHFEATGVKGVLMRPGYEDFYFDQVRHHTHAHTSCLISGDAIIAVHCGYLYQRRLYYLMPSYDESYGSFSPGRVLAYYLLQECYREGVDVFDLCIGAEPYKYEWTADEVGIDSFVDQGFIGRGFVGLRRLKRAIFG